MKPVFLSVLVALISSSVCSAYVNLNGRWHHGYLQTLGVGGICEFSLDFVQTEDSLTLADRHYKCDASIVDSEGHTTARTVTHDRPGFSFKILPQPGGKTALLVDQDGTRRGYLGVSDVSIQVDSSDFGAISFTDISPYSPPHFVEQWYRPDYGTYFIGGYPHMPCNDDEGMRRK